MPGPGLSHRKLSWVTVHGSGGNWGQILCSCLSNYITIRLRCLLSGSFVTRAGAHAACPVSGSPAVPAFPSLWHPELMAACPVRLWSESSYYFALGCLQPPDPWLPTWVHFLFGFEPAPSSSPGFNILVAFLSLPKKSLSAKYHPGRDPDSFQSPNLWMSPTPSQRPVNHSQILQ